MSISRRSLLRSLAALPVAHCLDGVASPMFSPTTSSCSAATAASVCVLLEGPWLIFQDPTTKLINAVTVGDSKPHACSVEKWNCGTFVSKLGTLSAGPSATVSDPSFTPGDYETVFNEAFNRNHFAWAVGDAANPVSVDPPEKTQRSVVLPVPTSVHMAGFLNHATVSDVVPGALKVPGVPPHIVTILEYSLPSGGSMNLTLPPSSTSIPIAPSYQILFRLQHMGTMAVCDELKHMTYAFNKNAGHIKRGSQTSPVQFKIDTDTSYTLGNDTEGFVESELGLQQPDVTKPCKPGQRPPVHPYNNTYANCAGGGIVVGGT